MSSLFFLYRCHAATEIGGFDTSFVSVGTGRVPPSLGHLCVGLLTPSAQSNYLPAVKGDHKHYKSSCLKKLVEVMPPPNYM